MIEYRWPLDIRCQPPSVLTPVTRYFGARSVFRADTSTGGAGVQYWKLQMNFSGLQARQHRRIGALLRRLDGVVNVLRIGPHDLCKPLGAAAGWGLAAPAPVQQPFSDGTLFSDGTGWTDAARQALVQENAFADADTLVLGGLLPNRADSLLEGDMMEIGGYLYSCQNDAASDAQGRARVVIWPRLRRPAYAATPVLFDNPTSAFQMAEGAEGSVSIGLGHLGGVGLSLVERLPE